MDPRAYSFNKDITYRTGAVYAAGTPAKLAVANPLDIVVASGRDSEGPRQGFTARVPSFLDRYKLPQVSSDHVVDLWNSQPMGFWQNQLNFAIWCASAGCGVSVEHMTSLGLLGALYRFHVYYTARRLLSELRVALPQEQSWNAFENTYDRRAYERICNEFRVSPNTDWRIRGKNNGLGSVYLYYGDGYHVLLDGTYYRTTVPHVAIRQSFTETTTNDVLHVDYIGQEGNTAWTTFILDKGEGFTQAGIVRLNDSVRTYVWAILGAQGQTRTTIIGTGTAFDAQKRFLVNLEDAILRPVDLPGAIQRYQDTLQYARSKVNFVFGVGLYMAPSDMLLRIGQIQGYNNEIQIATVGMTIGPNVGVNDSPTPPAPIIPVQCHVKPPELHAPVATTSTAEVSAANQHQGEKTALVAALVAVGLLFLWWR